MSNAALPAQFLANEPDAEKELAATQVVFEALAHPTRRHILLVLRFRGGRMSAGDIAARFSCGWSTVSNHLRLLQEAGLVSVEKQGRERVYSVRAETLLAVTGAWLKWFQP